MLIVRAAALKMKSCRLACTATRMELCMIWMMEVMGSHRAVALYLRIIPSIYVIYI